ncbi:hypothetical protein Bbelb_172810 [Branchiostoma belcheri]|nr:hypothetical protein Bbelb_172810 [Branchiostoma belcheri]
MPGTSAPRCGLYIIRTVWSAGPDTCEPSRASGQLGQVSPPSPPPWLPEYLCRNEEWFAWGGEVGGERAPAVRGVRTGCQDLRTRPDLQHTGSGAGWEGAGAAGIWDGGSLRFQRDSKHGSWLDGHGVNSCSLSLPRPPLTPGAGPARVCRLPTLETVSQVDLTTTDNLWTGREGPHSNQTERGSPQVAGSGACLEISLYLRLTRPPLGRPGERVPVSGSVGGLGAGFQAQGDATRRQPSRQLGYNSGGRFHHMVSTCGKEPWALQDGTVRTSSILFPESLATERGGANDMPRCNPARPVLIDLTNDFLNACY